MRSPFIHFLLAFAAFSGALSAYGVWYATVSTKSADVASQEAQIAAAGVNVGRITLARAALSEIEGDEASMQDYFVSESSVVTFINKLESLGSANAATVTVLSVAKGAAARPSLVLTLSIKGTFDAVMRTIGAIEYVPYSVSVSSLSVVQDTKNVWHADLSLIANSAAVASTTAKTL